MSDTETLWRLLQEVVGLFVLGLPSDPRAAAIDDVLTRAEALVGNPILAAVCGSVLSPADQEWVDGVQRRWQALEDERAPLAGAGVSENLAPYLDLRPAHSLTVTLPAATVDLLEEAVSRTGQSRDRIVDSALGLWLAFEEVGRADAEDDARWLAGWRR